MGRNLHEYRIIKQDKSICWISERTWCSKDKGKKPSRLEGLVIDITARKTVEEEIRTALLKEQEHSELKSRFISNTSHEFRTPLSVILSSINILEAYDNKLSLQQKKFQYDRIGESISNLTTMLDDVLFIERANASKIQFDPKNDKLHSLCTHIVSDIKSDKSIQTVIKIHDELIGDTHFFDHKLCYTIISNLVTNAIKYSPNGREVTISLTETSQLVQIAVIDKGIGISEQDIVHLFEPFFRASNVDEIKGSGLGLSIVKRGADLHRGTIKIESKLNKGSVFTFSFKKRNYEINNSN